MSVGAILVSLSFTGKFMPSSNSSARCEYSSLERTCNDDVDHRYSQYMQSNSLLRNFSIFEVNQGTYLSQHLREQHLDREDDEMMELTTRPVQYHTVKDHNSNQN